MPLIRCTRKLLGEMEADVRPSAEPAHPSRLGDWYANVAKEVPSGRPQIRYFPEGNQWVPRGDVVRCTVECDDEGQTVIDVDGEELSMEKFGRLLATYQGWGMRIEFTPDDATDRRPPLQVREPDEP